METLKMSEAIVELAKAELAKERLREKVDKVKEHLRRPWWVRLFPYRIKILLIRR